MARIVDGVRSAISAKIKAETVKARISSENATGGPNSDVAASRPDANIVCAVNFPVDDEIVVLGTGDASGSISRSADLRSRSEHDRVVISQHERVFAIAVGRRKRSRKSITCTVMAGP